MMPRMSALVALLAAPLAACASRPPIPSGTSQPLVIEEALIGRTVGEGVFTTITGGRRAFTADITGEWDGETLTLVEDFLFDDGETDRKTWRLTRTGPGEFVGTREDVVGEARGYQDGDAFRLEYLIDLETGDGGARRVGFRDVLVLGEDGRVINNANVGWHGFHVGRVQLVIERADETQ